MSPDTTVTTQPAPYERTTQPPPCGGYEDFDAEAIYSLVALHPLPKWRAPWLG